MAEANAQLKAELRLKTEELSAVLATAPMDSGVRAANGIAPAATELGLSPRRSPVSPSPRWAVLPVGAGSTPHTLRVVRSRLRRPSRVVGDGLELVRRHRALASPTVHLCLRIGRGRTAFHAVAQASAAALRLRLLLMRRWPRRKRAGVAETPSERERCVLWSVIRHFDTRFRWRRQTGGLRCTSGGSGCAAAAGVGR